MHSQIRPIFEIHAVGVVLPATANKGETFHLLNQVLRRYVGKASDLSLKLIVPSRAFCGGAGCALKAAVEAPAFGAPGLKLNSRQLIIIGRTLVTAYVHGAISHVRAHHSHNIVDSNAQLRPA